MAQKAEFLRPTRRVEGTKRVPGWTLAIGTKGFKVWFDSHCHLDFDAFEADRGEVLARAQAAGVHDFFVPGVEVKQWSKLGQLRRDWPGVHIGVGWHPYFLSQFEASAPEASQLEASQLELSASAQRLSACAVGECGLDGRVAKRGGPSIELQSQIFSAQIEVARELKLPIVVHVVQAHGAALAVFERFGRLPAGGVIHSYSGAPDLLPRYRRHNLIFGIGCIVEREGARKLRRIVAELAPDELLLETDAPDQPARAGEERNEPAALVSAASRIAAIRGVSLAEFAETTTANARRLYQLEA